MLISPEGHLTPLFQIEEAEKAPFDKPLSCFVKTQFGSLQGHVAIVHLLDALQQQYCSNLKVSDEGDYYGNRDATQLVQKMQFVTAAISSMTEGLQHHGLNKEAAEDPSILATRIERIAALVHQKLITEQEKLSGVVKNTPNDDWNEPSLEDEVRVMDRLRRKNELRSERMNHRIAESTAAGMSVKEAFNLAMREEGLPVPSREKNEPSEPAPEEPCETVYKRIPTIRPVNHRDTKITQPSSKPNQF